MSGGPAAVGDAQALATEGAKVGAQCDKTDGATAVVVRLTERVIADVVALLVGGASNGGCLALNLPLQLEEHLGVQTDESRIGGDLGGVLVVHRAERACGGSSDGGGTHCGSGGGGGFGFAVRGRQWGPYLWRIYNPNKVSKYATGFM